MTASVIDDASSNSPMPRSRPGAPLALPHEFALLDRVLAPGALSTQFQPIVDIRTPTPAIVAVECLTRGIRGSSLEAPDVLFAFARRKRAEAVVDRAAIATALASATSLPEALPLHLNVHASTLSCDETLPTFVELNAEANGIALSRLIFEIIEHAAAIDEYLLLRSLETFRSRGIGIALDDIGHGHSNFHMMLLTRPGILKVDRYVVYGIADDPIRQTVVAKLREVALALPALIVAEGIETLEDLETLRSLGVHQGQGYLFGKPASAAELVECTLVQDLVRRAGSCHPSPSTL